MRYHDKLMLREFYFPIQYVIPSNEDAATKKLMARLVVKNEPRSNIVSIDYTARSASEAARIANALVAEFVDARRVQKLAARVEAARTEFNNLRLVYGAQHPNMARAKDSLERAEDALLAEQNREPPNETELAALGYVVTARASTIPSGLGTFNILGIAAVMGLLCGVLYALAKAALKNASPPGKVLPTKYGAGRLANRSSSAFLFAAVLILLVFRGALSGQVPLYLSNRETVEALAEILAERGPCNFLDLGAGLGSTTVPLADNFPEHPFTGVENAPLTWLAGRLLSIGRPNIAWRWADLWATDLSEHDVVYAFLSPVPMPGLWEKIKREMKPGSLFISNTFPVPGVAPAQVIEVPCPPARPLYCYPR